MCGCNNNKGNCSKKVRQLNKSKIDITTLLNIASEQNKIDEYGNVLAEVNAILASADKSCPSQAQVDAINIFTQSELLQRN